jgi:hypothetical protein
MTLYTFRIRRDSRGKWRVETWDAEPPYGPGWSPALTGALTLDDARTFLDTALVEWSDDSRMGGRYTFAVPA